MKRILPLLPLLFSFPLFAQDDMEWKEASKESQAYHRSRLKQSEPPYGLTRVKGLIKKIKSNDDEDLVLDQKVYLALSLREKFAYHMLHGESFSQNCDAMPPIQEEQKKIFAYVPDMFDEFAWSERQSKFLSSNRDSVVNLLRECITKTNRVGVNFKQTIIEVNARELIPLLIKVYNITKKDLDILTVLMHLMKDNEYEPFLTSSSYKKLFGENSNYQDFLNYNKANMDLIIKRATEFYTGNVAKN